MAIPQVYIPQTDPYSIPEGFRETTTNGGGTAYLDSGNNKYIRDISGFKLFNDIKAPQALPGVVSSSAPVIQDENNLKSTIAGFALPDSGEEGAKEASASYTKVLDDRIAALEKRRESEIASINATFDAEGRKLEDTQAREAGAYNVALQRIGGYLGGSASSTGAILTLAKSHRDEVANLTAKRQAAIQAAQNAISDKEFDLARLKVQEVKDLNKEIYDRKNKYFDQVTKLQEEERAQQQLEISQGKEARDQQTFIVENIAPSLFQTLNSITDEATKEAYLQRSAIRFGIDPDMLKAGVIQYQQKQNEKVNSAILDLVKKYPDSGISNADIISGNINSVIEKVTNSSSYKLESQKTRAEIDKLMADAAEARSGGSGVSDPNSLAYFADFAAKNGGKFPPNLPKGMAGPAYQMAKERAAKLPVGTIIDADGFKISQGDIPAAVETGIAGATAVRTLLPELRDFIKTHVTYPGGKYTAAGGKLVGLTEEKRQYFNTLLGTVTSAFVQSRSGQAVSDKEYSRLSGLLPNLNQLNKYNIATLDAFERGITTEIRSKLDIYGARVKGVDYRTAAEKKAEAEEAAKFDE